MVAGFCAWTLDFMDFCYKLYSTKLIFFIPVPVHLCVLRLAPFVFNLNTYLSCQLEHFMHHLQNIKNKLFFTQQIPRQFQKTNPKWIIESNFMNDFVTK